MSVYIVGIIVPLIFSLLFRNAKNKKKRGLPVDVGGEPGYAIRNRRFTSPVETAWEGITTLAELFESSCKWQLDRHLLGTRKLISRDTEVTEDGKSFEKLHLGAYEWVTYGEAFEAVCSFASGLVHLGHKREERAAIFADTRAEWLIALQGCFRRNVTVVTIYSSLGEEALCHSLNETEVSTVICGRKELKKIMSISGQLDTVKRVIYMDDYGIPSEVSLAELSNGWTITSFVEVERLGRENPVDADLPLSADIAVIMYTSGSTGLPKGVMMTHRNVLAVVSAVMTIIPDIKSDDIYLAYLPLAHILELAAENVIVAVGSAIGYGSPLTLTDTSNKIKKGTMGDASMLRPTLMAVVPAILDRVRDGVRKKVDGKGGLSKKLFDLAYARRLSAMNGSWFGAWGLEKILWNLLVFSKVRAVLGGRVRYMLSGGAPLSGDTQRFINICFGAPIGQGYGLTETCAGGTFSDYDDTSVGRVGPPLPCSFVKLMNWPEGGYLTTDLPMPRGEIAIGGPNVTAGYFKNEQKTNEVYKVDERGMRWFYTAVVVNLKNDKVVTLPGISIVWGLVVMVMVYSVGHISGAHFNPAVTIAFATCRRFPLKQLPAYICCQVLGSTLASGTLRLIFEGNKHENFFGTMPQGSNLQSLVLEFVISFYLMFVISGVATDNRAIGELAGLAVGSTVLLNVLFAGPISGASMNPARSLGPAIIWSQYKGLWVYMVGPTCGTIAGAWAYNLIRFTNKPLREITKTGSFLKSLRRSSSSL